MMTSRQSLGIGAALLALDKLPFDVMFSDEIFNRAADSFGHQHGLDQIGACFRERLPFRGIGRDRRYYIGPGALRGAQHDPDAGGAGGNIVAIELGFGAVEIDRSATGEVERRLLLLAKNCPWL